VNFPNTLNVYINTLSNFSNILIINTCFSFNAYLFFCLSIRFCFAFKILQKDVSILGFFINFLFINKNETIQIASVVYIIYTKFKEINQIFILNLWLTLFHQIIF